MIEMGQKNVAKYAADVVRGKRELKDFVPEEAKIVDEYLRTRFQEILNTKASEPLPASEDVETEKTEEVKEPHELSPEQQEVIISILKKRFDEHPNLHEGVEEWSRAEKTLRKRRDVLWGVKKSQDEGAEPTIYTLESSRKYDGRPDPFNENKEGFYIGECGNPQRPLVAYDRKAEEYLRHKYPDLKIKGNAKDMAEERGCKLASERGVRHLVGGMGLVLKDPRWIETQDHIRAGSVDYVRNERGYFAKCTYTDVDGVLIHGALVYNLDEAFKKPQFEFQVYWA